MKSRRGENLTFSVFSDGGKIHPPKNMQKKAELGETREFFSYTKLIPFQLCYIYNELLRQSYRVSHHITPPKINMEPENEGFNRNLLFQGFIFRFHVNFRGCNDLDNFMGNPGNQDFLRKPATNSTLRSIWTPGQRDWWLQLHLSPGQGAWRFLMIR